MRVLTRYETQLLEAIAARIFPTTNTPGATEAGAATYIARALAEAYRPLLRRYRRGLRELDLHARANLKRPFLELSAPEQDVVLGGLEAGSAGPTAADFFQLVRDHVLEGIFGEPSYGGNRDLIGWRLVGFPGQQHGYPDPFIDRVVDIPPATAGSLPAEEG